MTDTLENIKLTANVWTDLYSITGITVGSKIVVQNIGACDVSLSSQETKPGDENATQIVQRGKWVSNDFNDAGAWAYCNSSGALINVRPA